MGDTITEETHPFKKEEMDGFRKWLAENGYDWNDPKLSLGYIKLGQVDLKTSFTNQSFKLIYEEMKDNLNIKSISLQGGDNCKNNFPYTLESDDWKKIQIEGLRQGYESRFMR